MYIALSSCLRQCCKCLVMVSVSHHLVHNHDLICDDNHILYLSKKLIQLVLEYIPYYSDTKVM